MRAAVIVDMMILGCLVAWYWLQGCFSREGRPMARLHYYVLSNEVGTILAVYGSALLSMAQDKAATIERQTGCKVILHSIISNRPVVGGSISMKGT
jgi:hypothetical protein